MKQYDFETLIPRFGRGSNKWENMRKINPGLKDGVIPFSVADMEFPLVPEVAEGLKRLIDTFPLGYAGPGKAYFQAVKNWMKRRHHWEIEDDWIIESRGVVEAFDAAIRAFTGEGDGVLLLTPVYYPMFRAIENNRRVIVESPLIPRETHGRRRYEIDFDDLAKKAKSARALLFCSPHNPVARVWTREELERIGRICLENGLVIISDEIHHDLVMKGYSHTIFAMVSEDIAGNCLVLTAPSKTFNLAGMQISNAIIPNGELRRKFLKALHTGALSNQCSITGYEACRLAYEKGASWLEQVLQVIAGNAALVKRRLERELPEVKVFDLEGTYLLWLDFNGLVGDYKELERIMQQEAQLFFDEGYIFGENGRGFERWNLACPSRYVSGGLDRLIERFRG